MKLRSSCSWLQMEFSTENLLDGGREMHHFHPALLIAVILLHVLCSRVVSPYILKVPGTHRRYLKRHVQYLALGQHLHSVVVDPLAVYLLFSDAEHNSHYSNSRWLEFVTVEISLAFFCGRALYNSDIFLFAFSVQTEDATLSVVSVVILLFSLDVLNFYWFYSMIHTYVKYYPKDLGSLKLL